MGQGPGLRILRIWGSLCGSKVMVNNSNFSTMSKPQAQTTWLSLQTAKNVSTIVDCCECNLRSWIPSVKQNNERNKVIMFILWLLVNRRSVRVKQKSKAKNMGKEKGTYYTVGVLFILCISSRRRAFLWQLFIAGHHG